MRRRVAVGLATAASVILIDQVSKWWILERIFALPHPIGTHSWHPPIQVTSFFNLSMVWNRGVSFGLLSADGDVARWALIVLALAITALLGRWLKTAGSTLAVLAIGLVIGGALGNVVDRLRFGAVADFLHFHALGYSFWVFNVADAAITVGVIALLADGLLARKSPT